MTPVKQTKLYTPDGIHNGNCYAACIASLLDLPLWMVPPWEDMFGRGAWYIRTEEWLLRMFHLKIVRTNGHSVEDMPEFYIANGLSPRDGKLVHDPHPSDAGVAEIEWTWHLASADA